MQFEPGRYYVGDLCYLDIDWDEVCRLTIKDNECLDGVFTLSDGRKFAMYRTAYGDGNYLDQNGSEYFVDSGSIGCIKVPDDMTKVDGGNIVVFDTPFTTSSENGVISFGHLNIDTDPEIDEDYWDDEDDETEYDY